MPPPLSLPLLTRLAHRAGAAASTVGANALMRCRSVTARPAPQHRYRLPLVAFFSASPSAALKKHEMPPRPRPPPDSDIEESYLKGSIVVKSQATRSRTQNRKIAREILAQKIDDLQNGEQSRSAIVGEVKRKKAASASKKSKRKYRQLEEEKAQGETAEVEIREQHAEDQTNSAPTAAEPSSLSSAVSPDVQSTRL
ncbi:putative peptide chain release factor-like protein, mitochondrial [Colletotrichum higginsianum]|uniref:Putative peptide chain release factor-like protein, mitochondrial n=1 Tax=Colletotrichum higginsianum TaxID=80884 RepID=A0A4T0W588_9PEZI|nr:putative peptide chain release factor-like protein, mitochondrial [Colletotrichum higginsianum]